MGRPSKFTPEFQRDAVDLVLSSGSSVNEVARELGVGNKTLRNLVNKRRSRPDADAAVPASPADKDAEIARLRAQVAELQQEKQILRKAAAYFARAEPRSARHGVDAVHA